MKKTLLLLIFTYYFLGCSKKQEITPYKSIYKSECNITDPQTDLKWIDKLNILTWNQVKGSYLYVYYGYIEKSDSDLLAKGSYFDKINPREIIILRLSREKRDNIKIEDWILIYDCSGNLLVEGWLDEWLTLPSKLKDKYVFDIRQI